ncbi:DMT family transporter [Bartonella sp. DGB2]|uniref:DMT family transporter n=1 Tax=Bartonella sp. DGB2 TaxID=3388426 RepID=UPI00398FFFF6
MPTATHNAYLVRLIYIVLMGFGFPIMRYMSTHFDPLNNNAVSFISSGLCLCVVCTIKFKTTLKKLFANYKLIFALLILSIFMTGNLFFFVSGLKHTSAVSGSVFGILAMPIGSLIAAIFYKDERRVVSNRFFIFGAIIAIIGSFVFMAGGHTEKTNIVQSLVFGGWIGYIFLTLSLLIQTIQNLIVKKLSTYLPTIVVTTAAATLAGFIFLGLSITTGVIHELTHVSTNLLIGLALAGIYSVFVSILIAFYIMASQSVIIFYTTQLLVPLSTAIIGYLTLGETLSTLQILGASIVILGCTLALKQSKTIPTTTA